MEQLKIIKTLAELKELQEYCKDKDFLAFDTETTGVERDSQVIGFSVCGDIELGYYVVLAYWDVAIQSLVWRETKDGAVGFFQSLLGKNLIMQNAPFDCAMIEQNYKVNLMPSVHTDTLVLGHLLNENRANGLKERGVELFGEDAQKEQAIMKASVNKNGGVLTKDKYELYKADEDLMAYYGAKDAVLTLKVFYHDVPILFAEGLDKFFYEEESMPLLRGPTYDLNTSGLRVDPEKLQTLKETLTKDCADAMSFITQKTQPLVCHKYPGLKPSNTFNVGSGSQRAWLLYSHLGNEFNGLTEGGRALCKALQLKMPYSSAAKREFIRVITERKGAIWEEAKMNRKTAKMGRPKKIGDPWTYMACGKESLNKISYKYAWVAKYLEYAKNLKLLNTYVEGIQTRMKYNIIRPSFLQHGTTSGRYSSKNPNLQNLPRDDKRVKSCIVARKGKVFVGADYAQLEPRVFASVSQDFTLLDCFKKGQDFYSVVGAPIFGKTECSLFKNDPNSFAKKYPALRDKAKVIALATPYGRTAHQQASAMGISIDEAQSLIDTYFQAYPDVERMMLDSHKQAQSTGVVHNLYGRPRRIPAATKIPKGMSHKELPYDLRTLLNLSMNHRVQSSAASVMNRAAIACWKEIQRRAWTEVKIVLQVHDELILEGPESLAQEMAAILKKSMEESTILHIMSVAEPKIAYNLADLK